jgi:hypothetical protein
MTSALRARASANGTELPTLPTGTDTSTDEALPTIEYDGAIVDAEQVPVHVAFARVMADVQSISKGDRRDDVGGRYNFRGVDRVVNAVGPALRRHGVLVLPVDVYDIEYRETRTSKGTVMQDVTLKMRWLVVGPMGDTLGPLVSAGQAVDTSDKGTAKAESVAQRVLFLTGLQVPTEDKVGEQSHDRGEAPAPKPGDYRDEAIHPGTSLGRLRTMRVEVQRHGLGGVEVVNESGDEEKLLTLIDRIGAERRGTGDAP